MNDHEARDGAPALNEWQAFPEGRDDTPMLRNTVRGILGLVLAAGATWLANFIVEQIFGPEEAESGTA